MPARASRAQAPGGTSRRLRTCDARSSVERRELPPSHRRGPDFSQRSPRSRRGRGAMGRTATSTSSAIAPALRTSSSTSILSWPPLCPFRRRVSQVQRREDDAVALLRPGHPRCYTNTRDVTRRASLKPRLLSRRTRILPGAPDNTRRFPRQCHADHRGPGACCLISVSPSSRGRSGPSVSRASAMPPRVYRPSRPQRRVR